MGLVFGSARTPRVFADSFRFPAPYIYNAELKRLLLFYNFMGNHFKMSQVVVFYLFYIFVVLVVASAFWLILSFLFCLKSGVFT